MSNKLTAALAAATIVASTPGTVPSVADTIRYTQTEIGGVSVFYREAGPRDAPTVVLLHGYPSSSRMWTSLIPLLADRYHVVAPDYPGFGLSAAPSPEQYLYTFDHLAETTEALLERIGVDRYTLFVQDYGGPVGFRMMMAHPDRLQALVVQNANVYAEGLGAKWTGIAKYWRDPSAHPEQLDAFMSLEGARNRHVGNSPNIDRYNPEEWFTEFALLSRHDQRAIQGSLLLDYRTNVAAYPVWQAWLRRHQPPTLVIWGRYDPAFIVAGAEAFKRDVPEAEIHIIDAGHFALDERTDEVASLTRDFLSRVHAVK